MQSLARRFRVLTTLLVLAVLVAGCGDGNDATETTEGAPASTAPASTTADTQTPAEEEDETSETTADTAADELISVNAAYIPVSAAAALHLGVNEGFFEAEGLDVTLTEAEPPSMIPSVLSGDIDFAFLNAPAVMVARENGLAVQGVAAASKNSLEPEDHFIQLVVNPDSGISSPADLAGRTVAVDVLYQLPHLSLLNALRSEGVDTSSIEFTELPFPAMPEAVAAGDVDTVLAVEPFATLSEAQGGQILMSASEGQEPELAQSVMLASEQFISANTDVVDRFIRGMDNAMAFAEENPDTVRQVISEFTAIPPEMAAQIRLPAFRPGFDDESWSQWMDVLVSEGLVSEDFDVEAAYYRP